MGLGVSLLPQGAAEILYTKKATVHHRHVPLIGITIAACDAVTSSRPLCASWLLWRALFARPVAWESYGKWHRQASHQSLWQGQYQQEPSHCECLHCQSHHPRRLKHLPHPEVSLHQHPPPPRGMRTLRILSPLHLFQGASPPGA